MTPDEIRKKALEVCPNVKAADAAWQRVNSDPRCHGKTARAARLAMLQVLADGGTIKAAEKAAWKVLA